LDAKHPESAKEALNGLISEYLKIFEPLSPGEAVDTRVRAEIRTSTSDPIYTKSYPYPTNMRGEVDRQIEELLRDEIIKPSKSPYYSPVWVVPKKPKN